MLVLSPIVTPENLHHRVIRALAHQVLEAARDSRILVFPKEADLCQQLGVSRTILREAVKVLVAKGMLEARQRLGTRATPRAAWNQLDPDILGWWAEMGPDTRFLRDLCELRLAIEPTAAGFAAVRASSEEIDAIGQCLKAREAMIRVSNFAEAVDLHLKFHSAVAAACHNSLLQQLNRAISRPLRIAFSYTTGLRAPDVLDIAAYRKLFDAIRGHDAMKAHTASEKIVGFAMLHVEEAIRVEEVSKRKKRGADGARPSSRPRAKQHS